MDITQNQILANCYHCGNKGLMNIVGIHRQSFGGLREEGFDGNVIDEPKEDYTWYLLSCPACHFVTLFEKYRFEAYPPYMFDDEILYPRNTVNLDGVPQHIRSAFESSLKVEQIDISVCLLALRRTLEAICKDKNAEGDNLDQMISDMIEKNILPSGLNDACWIIRQLGNEAAHADSTSIYSSEVKKVIGFVETIIDYTYALPHRIAQLKENIIKEKSAKSSNTQK